MILPAEIFLKLNGQFCEMWNHANPTVWNMVPNSLLGQTSFDNV